MRAYNGGNVLRMRADVADARRTNKGTKVYGVCVYMLHAACKHMKRWYFFVVVVVVDLIFPISYMYEQFVSRKCVRTEICASYLP